MPISALHSRGVGDFLDVLTEGFPEDDPDESAEPSIAIVGRPNVGKSTLFNRIVGHERSIVHDEPGTTRDAVDTVVEIDGRTYRFVDTAGMRRSAKVDESTEFFGSVRTMRALERCDIAVLVVDATEGISRQDQRIAEQIAELGRSAVVVLNKIDAVDAEDLETRRADLRRRLPHVRWAPMLDISAKTGRACPRCWKRSTRSSRRDRSRVPTPLLNAVIDDLQARTPIPSTGRGAAHQVRDAGRGGAADVRPVRRQRHPGHVAALPRARHPEAVRLRGDADPLRDAGRDRKSKARARPPRSRAG